MSTTQTGTATAKAGTGTGLKQSLGSWLIGNRTARLLVGVLAINVAANVVDVIPMLGPVAELVADLGAEPIAFLLAALILERGGGRARFRALVPFAIVGILKTALDALNLVPEVGGFMETLSEMALGALQIWILKRAVEHGHQPSASPAPGPGSAPQPVIDITPVAPGGRASS